jgi:hypothetical protein
MRRTWFTKLSAISLACCVLVSFSWIMAAAFPRLHSMVIWHDRGNSFTAEFSFMGWAAPGVVIGNEDLFVQDYKEGWVAPDYKNDPAYLAEQTAARRKYQLAKQAMAQLAPPQTPHKSWSIGVQDAKRIFALAPNVGGSSIGGGGTWFQFHHALILFAILPALWLISRYREYRRLKSYESHDHCLACGYNLTGNVSGVCPECGTKIARLNI